MIESVHRIEAMIRNKKSTKNDKNDKNKKYANNKSSISRFKKELCLLLILAYACSPMTAWKISAAEAEQTAEAEPAVQIEPEAAPEPAQPAEQAAPEDAPEPARSGAADDGSPDSTPQQDVSVPGTGTDTPDAVYDPPSLQTSTLYLAAGGSHYQLNVLNAASAVYEISSGSASAVSLYDQTPQHVRINPQKKGEAVLTVTAAGADGTQAVLTCRIVVSELSFSKELVEIYMNDADHSARVSLQGGDFDAVYYGSGDASENSLREDLLYGTRCSLRVGNSSVADAYFRDGGIYISGTAKGTTNVRVNIYGVSLSVKVKVYHYTLNKYTINTYKGSAKKTLKLKGAGTKKVTWVSGNKNVASVNSKGIVTIKGIGTTKITAKASGQKVMCIVSVSSKTAYRAVRDARAISQKKNIRYSQAYRMSANYYDCSSLVYRCYKPYGIRFGYKNPTWAPTAADEAYWCAGTKHTVSNGPVELLSCRLVPGDTIFYSYNGNNGRYLHIDHTAMFAGYSYDEALGYYGTVIEASSTNNSVVERSYYASDSIKLIGRPSKK